jgi:hypothetical protein
VEFGSTGAPLAVNVAIHGSFGGHQAGWAKNIKGIYLILHGAEDQGYPLTTVSGVVDQLRAAKVPFELRQPWRGWPPCEVLSLSGIASASYRA